MAIPWRREEKYFVLLLIWSEKIISNCLKIDAIHEYDNDLLLRQETQKKIACSGS